MFWNFAHLDVQMQSARLIKDKSFKKEKKIENISDNVTMIIPIEIWLIESIKGSNMNKKLPKIAIGEHWKYTPATIGTGLFYTTAHTGN